MPLIPRLFSLWRNLVHRNRVDRDLDEEVRAAFELLVDEKRQAGMRPEDARRAATLELGQPEGVKEQVRDARAGASVDVFVHDVRYAGRTLRRNPGFASVTIVTLALGIGATVAIFTVLEGVLLRTLPYDHPERIVRLWERSPERGLERFEVLPGSFLDWRERSTAFEALAMYRTSPYARHGPRHDGAAADGVRLACALRRLRRIPRPRARIPARGGPAHGRARSAGICRASGGRDQPSAVAAKVRGRARRGR